MTPRTFRKTFRDAASARAAIEHHRWLVGLDADVDLPVVVQNIGTVVEFEFVAGPTATPRDAVVVAEALGRVHRAAWGAGLDRVDVNQPYLLPSGHTISGFAPPRRARLRAALASVSSPLSADIVERWLGADLPAALYKDANPRNVIISPTRGPVLVDFDTLTLAPVGYDLAKFIVTLAMTFGDLPRELVLNTLETYRTAMGIGAAECPLEYVQVWAELHHLLTAPWIGRHYTHSWKHTRPWSAGDVVVASRSHCR